MHARYRSTDQFMLSFSAGINAKIKRISLVWRDYNEKWLYLNDSCHVVLYEELKRDVRFHLSSILQFLDIPLTYLDCAIVQTEGKFHRVGKPIDITSIINNINKVFIEWNRWKMYGEVYAHRRLFPPTV